MFLLIFKKEPDYLKDKCVLSVSGKPTCQVNSSKLKIFNINNRNEIMSNITRFSHHQHRHQPGVEIGIPLGIPKGNRATALY